MKAVAFAPAKAISRQTYRTRDWTCSSCSLQSHNARDLRQVRGFASRGSGYGQGRGNGQKKGRRIVMAAAATAGVAGSAFAFTDDIKHQYEKFVRTARVCNTLAISMNE